MRNGPFGLTERAPVPRVCALHTVDRGGAAVQGTPDHESSRIDVDGVGVHLLRGGPRQDDGAILFLHGAGGAGVWMPFHGLLAERHDVLAPDHPGFGGSDDAEDVIEAMDDLVYHYLALIEQLGLTNVNLVGSSLGGWLAAELAVHHPETFRTLTLLAPVGLELPEHPIQDLFGMTPEETVAAVFHDPAIAAQIFPAEPDLDFIMGLYREKISFARLAWSPYCANPKLERRLHRVTCPTLVLWGEHDDLVPIEHGERYVERIPDARLQVLPGVSHAPFIEDPAATAKAILDFVG